MRGAEWIAENRYREVGDARRFENWEFSWALVLATAAAARYAQAIGLESIRERVRALATGLRERLGTVEHLRVLDHGRELCAIVSVAVDNRDPRQLVAALREQRINASAQIREYAVLDYDDKGVSASLRLSPHYYNTEEEIDVAVSALRRLLT
jgi:selenocysteine lyase/cysteine desulfurase